MSTDNFAEIFSKTKKLVTEEKYNEALAVLMDVANNPLFNLKQQSIINNQIKQLTKFIKQNEKNLILNSAPKSNLINLFLDSKYDLSILEKLFEKYQKDLKNEDFLRLETIFLKEEIDNEKKIIFLNFFKNYDVNYDFNFYNANTKTKFKINPINNFNFDQYDFIYKLAKDLEAMFYKEPNKEDIAKQIVNKIYSYYFNDFSKIKYSNLELLDNITNFIESSFNHDYVVDENFMIWIKKILN